MATPKRSRLRLPSLFTRRWFRERAKRYALKLGDHVIGDVVPSQFKTGSLGWQAHTKIQIKVGDCLVWAQVNAQVTVIGSKELPRDDAAATTPQAGVA